VSHVTGESLSALDGHIYSTKVGRSTLENAALAFYRWEIELSSSTWVPAIRPPSCSAPA
jgi:hypothetical protein